MTSPLVRVSTVDALVADLKNEIFTGRLPGGAALREVELCDRYGVSRHSLRTALQILLESGLVSREPNRSVTVASQTPETVEDIYFLRGVLEVRAVEHLARTPEQLGRAAEALRAMAEEAPSASWMRVRDLDLNFHAAIIDGLGSPRTSTVFASLLDELRLAFLQMRGELEDPLVVIEQHRHIYERIEAGDLEGAVRATREHLEAARTSIAAALERPPAPDAGRA